MAFDVTAAHFQERVLERSHHKPVVVDFWAAWCGPCRALAPVLEAAVADRAGLVELAKVDTEAEPGLAARYGIQGIPAVKAFRDGEVQSEFTGALPKNAVGSFLDSLLPSRADELVAAGDESSLREALALEPAHADAALALARLLIADGRGDEADAVLANVAGSFAADGLRARLKLERDAALASAFQALDEGATERGLDQLVQAVAASADSDRRTSLRAVIVGELDALGVAHPLARETRRKLASALY